MKEMLPCEEALLEAMQRVNAPHAIAIMPTPAQAHSERRYTIRFVRRVEGEERWEVLVEVEETRELVTAHAIPYEVIGLKFRSGMMDLTPTILIQVPGDGKTSALAWAEVRHLCPGGNIVPGRIIVGFNP
ncbi:MAG: hypothetical protein Q7S05_02495 [bacterium]|nr:hypothetical protein [bacterium]